MNTRTALLVSLGCTTMPMLLTIALWSHLPAQIPTHWNLQGQVDGWMSPGGFLGFFLGLSCFLMVLLFGLPRLSPKGFEVDGWRPVYNFIIVITMAMFSAVHVAIVLGAIGMRFDMTKAVIAIVLVGLGVMGNLLGKVQRNFWVGVRTPWTLASDQVWTATHRLAARLMFGSGILAAIAIVCGVPPMAVFVAVMVALLYPVAYSYLVYRRIHR